MAQQHERFKRETLSGDAVTVGDVTALPQSRALTLRWPRGGWVWNRPVAVLVERGEEKKRIPIVDVTRIVQLGLFGLSLVFTVLGAVMWMMERSQLDE